MNALELPEQLKGPWEHALILTYGVDIPFFERSLWYQFPARCRNKIILADGEQYLEASKLYAQQPGLVRHLNRLYIVSGIFGSHAYTAAHAKLILLTNAQQGRLLVGSGNLNWQGYASGGELFTAYDYSADSTELLSAFLAVRELVDALIQRGSIGLTARKRIEYMWEHTPWFFLAPTSSERPVRDNLTSSFLDQLVQEVDGAIVEELWILSPFYDKQAIALERLLQHLQPKLTTILVQPGRTSVYPTMLQRVIDHAPGICEIRPFQRGSDAPYVHAKCYLVKLQDRAICLHGSPNLSQVAMLMTRSSSNVEIANLLTGPRNAFDYVFEALNIEPATTDLTALKLDFHATEEQEGVTQDTWRLTGGEWNGKSLILTVQGTLPNLNGLALVINENLFPLMLMKLDRQSHFLELLVPEEAQGLLSQPLPIVLLWEDGEATRQTNAIFVCNMPLLDAALQDGAEHKLLDHVADLDLDDKELEELLGELNEALVIDQGSIWQLAGRSAPTSTLNDEAGKHIAYETIDYNRLRNHPKIQQYLQSAGSKGYIRSRLQIILNAITSYFQKLGERATISTYMGAISVALEESEEVLEESLPAIEEKQQRHWSAQQRIRRLFTDFIQRYLQGIRNPKFCSFAGYEIVTQNYAIFTHVLWRLFAKGWVEEPFIVDALIQSWDLFWGNESKTGYWYLLDKEEQTYALQLLKEYHSDANMLASLFYSAKVTSVKGQEKNMFALQAIWRTMLCKLPFPLETQALAEAKQMLAYLLPYEAPTAITMVNGLAQLARYDTRANFLRQLKTSGRYVHGSCNMEKHPLQRQGMPAIADCLIIRSPNALADYNEAMAVLQEWTEAESLDYYRIMTAGHNDDMSKNRLIFYDVSRQKGKYWNKEQGGNGIDFEAVPLQKKEWDENLRQLRELADVVDG